MSLPDPRETPLNAVRVAVAAAADCDFATPNTVFDL
jgi:hypothetical protein